MNIVANRLELIKALPPGSVAAEIGVRSGDFSHDVLANTYRLKWYMIDPWIMYPKYPDNTQKEHEEFYDRAQRVAAMYPQRCEIIRGCSDDVAMHWDREPLDAVYLDGNHSFNYVLQDLIQWSRRLKDTGCLMGHDYIPSNSKPAMDWNIQVIEAVDFFCYNFPWKLTYLTKEEFPSFRLDRL
jgi:Methyltransferase domain